MKKKEIIIILLLILLVIILRIPSLFEPYWYGDEGITLTVGQTIRNGGILYKDIADNKTPLLYFLTSIFYTLPLLRLLLFFWVIGLVVVFYHFGKEILKKEGVIPACLIFIPLTCLPLVEGNIANGEIFFLLPDTVGMLLALLAIKRENNKLLIFSGFSFGLGFLFKIPAVFDLLPVIFYYWFYNKQPLKTTFLIMAGFLIPILLVTSYFIYNKALSDFWEYGFKWNFLYSSYKNTFILPYGGLIIKGLLAGIVLFSFCLLRKKLSKNLILILLWLFFAYLGGQISMRGYAHYMLPTMVPLALLVGYLFTIKKIYFYLILMFSIVVLGIANYGSIEYQKNYYLNFIQFIRGNKNEISYRNYFDPNTQRNYEVANYLNSTKKGKIFIWGDIPLVYALSQRQTVARFPAAYNIIFQKARQEETIRRLINNLPSHILIVEPQNYILPGLDRIIIKDYNLIQRIGDTKIYERKT